MMPNYPSKYKDAGLMMLISGILNALSSFVWFLALIWICVGVFWLIPLTLSIIEIVTAAKVMNGQRTDNPKSVAVMGIVAGIFNMNIISIVLDAIAMSNLGDMEVQRWLLSQDNSYDPMSQDYGQPQHQSQQPTYPNQKQQRQQDPSQAQPLCHYCHAPLVAFTSKCPGCGLVQP